VEYFFSSSVVDKNGEKYIGRGADKRKIFKIKKKKSCATKKLLGGELLKASKKEKDGSAVVMYVVGH